MTSSTQDKIYHEDRDELSKNNIKIVTNIQFNQNIDLANQLLAQAYLFLTIYKRKCLYATNNGFEFGCNWCKGCDGCKSDDGYCSKYCLHADDCVLAEFMNKLEQTFK